MNISLEDILTMAKTVYGEARSQSLEGQKAVAHVIINRTASKGFPKDHTLAATCLRRRQFSCWNVGDPNRGAIERLTLNNKVYRTALNAVLTALGQADFTNGANHYYATWIKEPYWAKGKEPVYIEGSHRFYKL